MRVIKSRGTVRGRYLGRTRIKSSQESKNSQGAEPEVCDECFEQLSESLTFFTNLGLLLTEVSVPLNQSAH